MRNVVRIPTIQAAIILFLAAIVLHGLFPNSVPSILDGIKFILDGNDRPSLLKDSLFTPTPFSAVLWTAIGSAAALFTGFLGAGATVLLFAGHLGRLVKFNAFAQLIKVIPPLALIPIILAEWPTVLRADADPPLPAFAFFSMFRGEVLAAVVYAYASALHSLVSIIAEGREHYRIREFFSVSKVHGSAVAWATRDGLDKLALSASTTAPIVLGILIAGEYFSSNGIGFVLSMASARNSLGVISAAIILSMLIAALLAAIFLSAPMLRRVFNKGCLRCSEVFKVVRRLHVINYLFEKLPSSRRIIRLPVDLKRHPGWFEYVSLIVATIALIIAYDEYMEFQSTRLPDRISQAWETLHLATGKPGEGGRTSAITTLLATNQRLNGVDLSNADLTNVHLKSNNQDSVGMEPSVVEMIEIQFKDAKLEGVIFDNVNLTNAMFNQSEVYNSIFSLAQLTNSNWIDSTVNVSLIEESELTSAIFDRARFLELTIKGSEHRRGSLQNLSACFAEFIGVKMHSVKVGGNWFKAVLKGAEFLNSEFLSQTSFVGAQLQGATLRNTELYSVDFRYADLSNAEIIFDSDRSNDNRLKMYNVNFAFADLRGATISSLTTLVSDDYSANVADIQGALIDDLKAPPEFISWALKNGAVIDGRSSKAEIPAVLQERIANNCGSNGLSIEASL